MKKQRKTCKDCGICQPFGEMGKCHFGGGFGAVVALHNRACKMFVPAPAKKEKEAVEPGKAPFCGDYAKCNNAEGCDSCREFELWAAEKEHGHV